MAQNKSFTQKIERIEDTLYLINNEERFKVDTETVTVKLKSTEMELGTDYKIIRSNRLGYIDIKVPEGIHGQDIDSVGLNLPDDSYEKPLGEDVDSNETNHYYQFYYNLRNYNGEGKGQAQEDISLNYVPDGFLNSIYSIEDDIINPNLERRQPNQNYNIDDMVYAPGLPTEKVLDDEGVLHILDLCLKATTSGQTSSKENLDVGMLAKLNSGSQF